MNYLIIFTEQNFNGRTAKIGRNSSSFNLLQKTKFFCFANLFLYFKGKTCDITSDPRAVRMPLDGMQGAR